MKLLLDEGLPRGAAALLTEAGIACYHVFDLGLNATDDSVIIAEAVRLGCVAVTLDSDFHERLALTGAVRPSVIRIRIEGLRELECAELLKFVVERHKKELSAGTAISIQSGGIRCRALPLS